MLVRYGWTLYWHALFKKEIERLKLDVLRVKTSDPNNYKSNPKYKLLQNVRNLIIDEIPINPKHCKYNLWGNLSAWKRESIGRRYRLFFRYYSNNMNIIYAWMNNENTLRKSGDGNDPYVIFSKMINNGKMSTDQMELQRASSLVDDILGPK